MSDLDQICPCSHGLCLDCILSLPFSPGTTSAQPGVNGAVDTDELILNIQRLYAATCRGG